ncbi:MAG TPA: outer membrane protein assembly factor BamC [Burkholderiaceae bacterium]|nr:outer membrane protein assembly factor BamC [Burkholderiaceae bacterium]
MIVRSAVTRWAAAGCAVLGIAACSSVDSFLTGDRIDYKSQANKTAPLEVPPDLTQLARDSRYQPQRGVVSASDRQVSVAAPAASVPVVAANTIGDMHVERDGNQRWLVTPLTPEALWPQLRLFWTEAGFSLAEDDAQTGVMETDWAENRAKIPIDGLRKLFGGLLEPLYSTGERDRFRTRVERTPTGSEIYISHRGIEEYMSSATRDIPVWRNRPNDPQLEAEMLARLMVKLGGKTEVAGAPAVAPKAPPPPPARAREVAGAPGATLEFNENFDRAWRQVGLALDRSGFTVEDRDRAAGVYFVRYIDPKYAGREEPNFFAKLFSSDKDQGTPQRYRIVVKGAGEKTQVAVQNSQGTPENGAPGKQIVALLVNELK